VKNIWQPGGYFDTLDKFVSSLGHENAAMAIKFASIPWNSAEDVDRFIIAITGSAPLGGGSHDYTAKG
jgi:hypothetical protein